MLSWWETTVEMLPNLLMAIVCMALFTLLAKTVRSLSRKYISRWGVKQPLSQLLSQIAYIGVFIWGMMVALDILHLDKTVSSILAGVGIAGLALGFAFQATAANFMSGAYIAIYNPYTVGDVIETSTGHRGVVLDVDLRVTKIQDFDGPIAYIPNRKLFEEYFINYTEEGKRRVRIDIGVAYNSDLEKVQRVALESVSQLEHVLQEEPPTVFWTGFGESSINFSLNVWFTYKRNELHYIEVRNETILAVKKAFDSNGIKIPFPIRTLDFGIEGGERLSEHWKPKQGGQA